MTQTFYWHQFRLDEVSTQLWIYLGSPLTHTRQHKGVPGKKPYVTTDKLLESPPRRSLLPCETQGEVGISSAVP